MKYILLGGGGAVGADLGEALRMMGQKFDVVERDYYTHGGQRFPTSRHDADGICGAIATDDSILVNLVGLGDAYCCEQDPTLAVQLNVEEASTFARRAAILGLRMIHISTWEVYGGIGGILHEGSACRPASVYAKTKYLGETSILCIGRILDTPVVALRIGPVIGPSMRAATAVRSFMDAAAAGRPLMLRNGGAQTRQFLDYRDFAQAVVRLSAQPCWKHDIYNVASAQPISVLQLAKLVLSLRPGSELEESTLGRTEPSQQDQLSVDLARESIGWLAERTIADSLEDLAGRWWGRHTP